MRSTQVDLSNQTFFLGVFRARLIACGYSQVPGIDFKEVYSPVVKRYDVFENTDCGHDLVEIGRNHLRHRDGIPS